MLWLLVKFVIRVSPVPTMNRRRWKERELRIQLLLLLRLHRVVDELLVEVRIFLMLGWRLLRMLTPLASRSSCRGLRLPGPGARRASRRSWGCWRSILDVVVGDDSRL